MVRKTQTLDNHKTVGHIKKMQEKIQKFVWIIKNIDRTQWILSSLGSIGAVIGGKMENLPITVIVVLALVTFTMLLYLIPAVRGVGGKRIRSAHDKTYAGKEISILDLIAPDEPIVKNCSFNECIIKGPAMLILSGTMFHGHTRFSNLPRLSDALFDIGDKKVLYGSVLLDTCTFRSCVFKEIGIMGTPEQLERYENWIKKG